MGEFAQSAAPGAGAVAVCVCVCVCVVCVVCMYAHSVGQRVNGMSVRVCVVVWCVLHVWWVYMRTVCASVSVSSAPVYGCASVRPPKCPNASSKKKCPNVCVSACARRLGALVRTGARVLCMRSRRVNGYSTARGAAAIAACQGLVKILKSQCPSIFTI